MFTENTVQYQTELRDSNSGHIFSLFQYDNFSIKCTDSCYFLSVLQDTVPEAIPRQKCHMNMVRFSTVMEIRVLEM
jgi:hypothetical protein